MAEYIKREDVISAMCFGCNQQFSDEPCEPSECALRQAINAVPAADVVPKSEVERWKENFRILDAECSRLEKYESNFYDEVIKATAEVARAIFEEIEDIAILNDHRSVKDFYTNHPLIAELKKKYIPQDCPTCKHMVSCEPNVFGICEEYEEKKK